MARKKKVKKEGEMSKQSKKPQRPVCSYCGKDFQRTDTLKRHLKTIHGIEVSFGTKKLNGHGVAFDEVIAAEELSKRGYLVAKQEVPVDQKVKVDLEVFEGETFKVGLVADTHLGSRFQQLTHLTSFYHLCAQRGIKAILNAGDVTDGQNVYRGQQFELFCHGADAQADYAIKHYPKVKGITTYVIGGN